jgi:hypothetical protein
MNIQEIEKILERFYNGETTLREEKVLKDFFSGPDVPDHLKAVQAQFIYYNVEKSELFDARQLENNVMKDVSGSRIKAFFIMERKRLFWISGIAATILLFLGIYLAMNPVVKKVEDTYSDPVVAYNKTKDILLYVSAKFNRGTRDLDKISKIDEQKENLGALGKFDKGIEEANKIKEFNKIEKVFGTKN